MAAPARANSSGRAARSVRSVRSVRRAVAKGANGSPSPPQLDTAPDRDERPRAPRLAPELLDEPRLADPRLPHEHQRARPVRSGRRHLAERGGEHARLGVPPHEDGAERLVLHASEHRTGVRQRRRAHDEPPARRDPAHPRTPCAARTRRTRRSSTRTALATRPRDATSRGLGDATSCPTDATSCRTDVTSCRTDATSRGPDDATSRGADDATSRGADAASRDADDATSRGVGAPSRRPVAPRSRAARRRVVRACRAAATASLVSTSARASARSRAARVRYVS